MTARPPSFWIAPERLFDGQNLLQDVALEIMKAPETTGGRVGLYKTGALCQIADLAKAARVVPLRGVLCAGFLDLQVNGGGNVLFNNDQSAGAIRTIAAAHRHFGTVGILPTVITDHPDVLARAVDAVLDAKGAQGLLGLHIEGPHIAPSRRGTHAAQWVRPFEMTTLDHILRLRGAGVFVKITLAPESVTPQHVHLLVQAGALVSIGHSDADAQATRALLAAGARAFTHLFNAMSPMLHRAPGVVGACINSDAYAGIICDGHHVDDEMVALAIRARPIAGRMFLVSDAMATIGGSDRFSLYGDEIHLKDGRLINAEGALAGAHVTMAQGVSRLIHQVGVAPLVALDMAISAPSRLIGAAHLASPTGRNFADIILLDQNWAVAGVGEDMLPG